MGAILQSDDFTIVAEGGLSDSSNTIAHSMAWFRDKLFMGVTSPAGVNTDHPPGIFRFDPEAGAWDQVFTTPPHAADARAFVNDIGADDTGGAGGGRRSRLRNRSTLPTDYGFRSMIVFQGKSDAAPCLYTTTMSRWGGRLLRSEDGEAFSQVGDAGLGDDEILSFRGLTEFDGKLFAAQVGHITDDAMDRNLAKSATVHVSDDPASGKWQPACLPGFGDADNRVVFSLATAHGYLYAGTGNPERGFQLWRTKAKGKAPFKWEMVLEDGANRYNTNYAAATMVAFNGDLYVGTGITGYGYDKEFDIGPSAAELVRVHEDGSWDLIFGEPRFSPQGLKVPFAAAGPGMDNIYNSVVWAMNVHDGVLYLGMHNWEPHQHIQDGNFGYSHAGSPLFASKNGDDWEFVMDVGGRDHFGVRSLCSTPAGQFVGSCCHTKMMGLMAFSKGGRRSGGQDGAGFKVYRAAG